MNPSTSEYTRMLSPAFFTFALICPASSTFNSPSHHNHAFFFLFFYFSPQSPSGCLDLFTSEQFSDWFCELSLLFIHSPPLSHFFIINLSSHLSDDIAAKVSQYNTSSVDASHTGITLSFLSHNLTHPSSSTLQQSSVSVVAEDQV